MAKKILILGVVLIICLGILSACTPKPSNIVCKAAFSNNWLELPVLETHGRYKRPPWDCNIQMSINEIFSKITIDESLSVKLVDNKIFISRDNDDGTKDYFIIREQIDYDGNKREFFYDFFDMGAQINFHLPTYIDANGETRTNQKYKPLLIPFHLICENFWMDQNFESTIMYTTKYGIDEFFDYYSDCGWYDVERGEDYILIKGYIDHEKTSALTIIPIKIQFEVSIEESNISKFNFIYHRVTKN